MNTAYIKKEKIIEIIWFVVVVTLFIFSFKMLRSGELQMRVASFGMLAPAVIVLLKMTTLVVAPLGGTPIYVLSGALFGNFQGFLISIIGDVLGSSACFFLEPSLWRKGTSVTCGWSKCRESVGGGQYYR
jgi:uncharacterized membrane protein YdjX (TVP38/TMEM64 family)